MANKFISKLFSLDDLAAKIFRATIRDRFWLRSLAIITLISFLLPYVGFAFTPATFATGSKTVFYQGKSLELPGKFGSIAAAYQGAGKTIIHIQDLHCNYEVQKNIANIIGHLSKSCQLKLVGIEGSSQSINTSKLSTFPVQEVKEQAGDYFVREGKLSGAELVAATSQEKILLEGVETAALYQQNRQSVGKLLNDESQGYCEDLREALNEMKEIQFNQALRKFDAKRTAFRNGELELLPYCADLFKTAKSLSISLGPFVNLRTYIQKGNKWFDPEVDPEGISAETTRLDTMIREQLYRTTVEREIDAYEHRLDIIEKMVSISATGGEIQEFASQRNAFSARSFVDFLQKNNPDQDLAMLGDVLNLDNYLKTAQEFYQVADARSEHFVANLMKKMDDNHQTIAVMVTGGFHTDKIMQLLKEKNVSCVSVKPRLMHQDIVNPYFSLLKDKHTPLDKLLAENQVMLALATSLAETTPNKREAPLSEVLLTQEQKVVGDQMDGFMQASLLVRLSQKFKSFSELVQNFVSTVKNYREKRLAVNVQAWEALAAEQGAETAKTVVPYQLANGHPIMFWLAKHAPKLASISPTGRMMLAENAEALVIDAAGLTEPQLAEVRANSGSRMSFRVFSSLGQGLARGIANIVNGVRTTISSIGTTISEGMAALRTQRRTATAPIQAGTRRSAVPQLIGKNIGRGTWISLAVAVLAIAFLRLAGFHVDHSIMKGLLGGVLAGLLYVLMTHEPGHRLGMGWTRSRIDWLEFETYKLDGSKPTPAEAAAGPLLSMEIGVITAVLIGLFTPYAAFAWGMALAFICINGTSFIWGDAAYIFKSKAGQEVGTVQRAPGGLSLQELLLRENKGQSASANPIPLGFRAFFGSIISTERSITFFQAIVQISFMLWNLLVSMLFGSSKQLDQMVDPDHQGTFLDRNLLLNYLKLHFAVSDAAAARLFNSGNLLIRPMSGGRINRLLHPLGDFRQNSAADENGILRNTVYVPAGILAGILTPVDAQSTVFSRLRFRANLFLFGIVLSLQSRNLRQDQGINPVTEFAMYYLSDISFFAKRFAKSSPDVYLQVVLQKAAQDSTLGSVAAELYQTLQATPFAERSSKIRFLVDSLADSQALSDLIARDNSNEVLTKLVLLLSRLEPANTRTITVNTRNGVLKLQAPGTAYQGTLQLLRGLNFEIRTVPWYQRMIGLAGSA